MSTCAHSTYASQVEFSSEQPKEGSPATLFRQRPDRSFRLDFYNDRLRFPDGAEHEIWSFEDESSGRGLPGPPVRAREGEVVHVTVEPSKNAHTVHWHGIEPDPRNDGVGHTSFEVTGSYTYQWRPQPGVPGDPNKGAAGTYFYHCHVNTVLHVQMGMFGPLVVDPVTHPAFPVRPGARRAFVDGPEYDVATETLLVPYSVDPRWHELGHAAGLSGEDVGLNRFEPKHFYLLGGNLSTPFRGGGVHSVGDVHARPAGTGLPTLLRVNNANYFPTTIRFTDVAGRPVVLAEVIAHDGRAYRDTSSPTGPSRPPRDLGRPIRTAKLAFGAAERYDVLLQPPRAGEYRAHVDWVHWVTRKRLATRTVRIVAE
jgi:FtsP/CotA-like multicopper oxidase with cupredoxin domain